MTNGKPRSRLATALRSPYLSIAVGLVMLTLINLLEGVYNPVERIAFSVFVSSVIVGGITAIIRHEDHDGLPYDIITIIACVLAAIIAIYGNEAPASVFFIAFGTAVAIRTYNTRKTRPRKSTLQTPSARH